MPRSKQRGSGLLGQGTYGCTFSPPVPCDQPPIVLKNKKAAATAAATATAPAPEQIGKVYPIVSSAVAEFESSKLLNRIDPKQEVFLYSKAMCPVKRTDVEAQSESHNCRLLRSAPSTMSQLIQPHGGLELIKYAAAAHNAHGRIARAEIAAILLNLFSGIQRLIKLGYVHQDIKGPNVVVRPAAPAAGSADRPPEVRLIDFGTLMTFADYYQPIINYLMNVPNYAVNPPEYRLIAARNHTTTDAFLATEHRLLLEYIPVYLRSTLIARFGLHIATDRPFRAYVDAMLSKSLTDRLSELRRSRAAEKADLWSVGYSILFIYQYLKPSADEPPEVARLFQELVTGLLRFIPDDRISITEAIRLTKRILKATAPTSPDRVQAEYYQEIFAAASPASPASPSVPQMPPTPIHQTAEAQMYNQMTIAELRQRDTFKTMSKKGKWQLRKADLVASLAETKRAARPTRPTRTTGGP